MISEVSDSEPHEEVAVQCFGRDDSETLRSAVATGRSLVIAKGQTCAAAEITIPYLRIETGGILKPLPLHEIVLSHLSAGRSQIFANALPGEGQIEFSDTGQVANPEWWIANKSPGSTDMTAAIQAAITATGGRGRIFFPKNSYLVTDTLTIPPSANSGVQTFSPLVLEGEGPFLSNLINKAPANKPTILINRDLVTIRNLGFWGDNNYPNDGIKVSLAGRIYIDSNEFFVKGNAIYLERAQSVWITNNFGSVSAGSPLPPPGVTTHMNSYAKPTDAFVYVNLPDRGGYAHHIVIRDNMNEGYNYQVYTNNPGQAINLSWEITGNQFESSASGGLKLDYLQSFEISSNYLSEGTDGYAIDLNNCRYGRIGPNYIHTQSNTNVDIDKRMSTIRLADSHSITFMGAINRLYLLGSCRGIIAEGTFIDRIQDETSDHQLTLINSVISDIGVPSGMLNALNGFATWYSNTTDITAYPTARVGDRILMLSPTAGGSLGWICTRASSAGPLERVRGNGDAPTVLGDYAAPTAYDFRITVISGGKTGVATYKVEWRPQGHGAYTDLTSPTRTTELAHLIKREGSDGPLASFSIKWATDRSYVTGDTWELRSTIPPVWSAFPSK
jgi:hypothetical protein